MVWVQPAPAYHGEEREEPVDDEQSDEELEHGKPAVAAPQRPAVLQRLAVRPRQPRALARHGAERRQREQL